MKHAYGPRKKPVAPKRVPRATEEERRLREGKEAELRVELQEQAKARAPEQQRLLEHEKELAAITAVEKAKIRSRRLVIGGLVVMVVGSGAGYAFGVKPALERKALEAESARQAQEQLVDAQERADQAEEDKERFEQKLEAREQREREREQRVKDRPKSRAKDKGCAPDDPLCGIKFD
jgi:hypothetical protein